MDIVKLYIYIYYIISFKNIPHWSLIYINGLH